MAKVSLDTKGLLRWALYDLPEQAVMVEHLIARHENIEVADTAIIEMIFALEKVYKLPRDLVVEHVEHIMTTSQINCNRQLFTQSLSLYRQQQTLSIIDCCLVAYASLNQAEPLYTFDQALAVKVDNAALIG